MSRKEELGLEIKEQGKIFRGVHQKLNYLKEELKDLVEMPKRKAMVGRFFWYENRYGRGDDFEPWSVYVKVVEATEGFAELRTISFQKDSNGEISVNLKDSNSVFSLSGENVEEISENFFLLHWQLLENEMAGIVKGVK